MEAIGQFYAYLSCLINLESMIKLKLQTQSLYPLSLCPYNPDPGLQGLDSGVFFGIWGQENLLKVGACRV